MAVSLEVLGVGSAPDDETGDTARDGGLKIKNNFAALETQVNANETAIAGKDAWGDPVDANIVPAAAATYTLGTSAASFASLYANNVRAQDSSALLLSVDTKTGDTATSDIRVYGQDARATATTNLDGGDVDIKAGRGAQLSAGDADGGFVYLNGGQGYGTGTHGNVVVGNNYGNLQVDSQIVSTVTTGTAPLTVASTTVVTNLNADLLDGNEATAFATAAQGSTADTALQNVVEDTTPQLGGNLDGQGHDLNNLGVVFLTEQAAAEADVAGKGQFWVKTATPNVPMFTDDAGTDFSLLSVPFTSDVNVVADQDYVLWYDAPFPGTITMIRTESASGTCTLTGKVNTTALGGTANSVSSTAQEQEHTTSNTFVKGDKVQYTVSSNSACLTMAVTFYITRTG